MLLIATRKREIEIINLIYKKKHRLLFSKYKSQLLSATKKNHVSLSTNQMSFVVYKKIYIKKTTKKRSFLESPDLNSPNQFKSHFSSHTIELTQLENVETKKRSDNKQVASVINDGKSIFKSHKIKHLLNPNIF